MSAFPTGRSFCSPKQGGWPRLNSEIAFGWPILAGLFHARVGSFFFPSSNFYFLPTLRRANVPTIFALRHQDIGIEHYAHQPFLFLLRWARTSRRAA